MSTLRARAPQKMAVFFCGNVLLTLDLPHPAQPASSYLRTLPGWMPPDVEDIPATKDCLAEKSTLWTDAG